MKFSYGKLLRSNVSVGGNSGINFGVTKIKFSLYFFQVFFLLFLISVAALQFSPKTEMLTHHSLMSSGSSSSLMFWSAVVIGSGLGFLLPLKWTKRLGYAVLFSFLLYGVLTLAGVGLYDNFQERQLFKRGASTFEVEQFRIADVRSSGKGRKYAVVENKNYKHDARIRVDREAYEFLDSNLRYLSGADRKANDGTGHCVNLQVEHNLDASRIIIDDQVTLDQFVECSPPA